MPVSRLEKRAREGRRLSYGYWIASCFGQGACSSCYERVSEVRKSLLPENPTLETLPGPLPCQTDNRDDWLPRHLPFLDTPAPRATSALLSWGGGSHRDRLADKGTEGLGSQPTCWEAEVIAVMGLGLPPATSR